MQQRQVDAGTELQKPGSRMSKIKAAEHETRLNNSQADWVKVEYLTPTPSAPAEQLPHCPSFQKDKYAFAEEFKLESTRIWNTNTRGKYKEPNTGGLSQSLTVLVCVHQLETLPPPGHRQPHETGEANEIYQGQKVAEFTRLLPEL